MEYQLIQKEDITQNRNITLTVAMIKILHNACVDILKQEPNMVAYKAALEELDIALQPDYLNDAIAKYEKTKAAQNN